MKKLFLALFILPLLATAQTTYTWDGSSSTDWNTAANWTPAAVPGSGDHVTLANVTNDPVLDANRTVNNLTLSAGTVLDLSGYTLTVSGAAALGAGTMTDGTLLKTTGTIYFSGTTMDCEVDVTADIQSIYDSRFKETVLLDETEAGGYYMRGNRFDASTVIENSSTGYIRTGNNIPDTFMAPVTFNLEAAGYIVFGHNAVGAYFADDVTVNNHSGNANRGFTFGGNSNSTARFEGDIIMNVSSGSGFINFYNGTNTHVGNLLIGTEGVSAGAITLTKYSQTSAVPVDLSDMGGTSTLVLGSGLRLKGDLTGPNVNTSISGGCVFEGTVDLPKVNGWGNGSRFEGVTDLTIASSTWVFTAGNMFMDTTTITRTVSNDLYMGNNSPDTFLAPVTFNLEIAGYIIFGHNAVGTYFADDVTLNNHSGNTGRGFTIGGNTNSTIRFAEDIVMNVSSGSGYIDFYLGTNTHEGLLRIGDEGYHSGVLTLNKYIQTASGTIDLSDMDGTSSLSIQTNADIEADLVFVSSRNITMTGATLQGDVEVESPSLAVTGCDFHGSTRLEKTGSGTNNLNGGNIFHGPTTIENSTSANYVYWGNTTADVFNGDLTLINHSSQPLWMNYNTAGQYGGDITLDGTSSKVIRFGNTTSGQKAVFNGTADQHLTITTSGLDVQFYRAQVNKGGGRLKVNNEISINYELALTDGIIEMDDADMLILKDGVLPTATDSSYIEGAVKKIGNDAFTFPVGRNGAYRPIGIGAPSNVTDAFTAEYFESNSDWVHDHSSRDGSLNHLSTNEYWTMTRNVGSSTPVVTLSWDTITSCTMDPTLAARHIAGWDGSNWDDLGNGSTTGNADKGTVSTASGVTAFNMFVLESDSVMGCAEYDTLIYINSLIHNDSLVRVLWTNHTSQIVNKYILQKGSDSLHFSSIDTAITAEAVDLMTVDISLVNPLDSILFSTESDSVYFFNEIVANVYDQFDAHYRLKVITASGYFYSPIVKPVVKRNIAGLPTLQMIDIRDACPLSFDPPPAGFINTGLTESFVDVCEGECITTTYTLYAESEWSSSCIVPECVGTGPINDWDCECSCTYDPCCIHSCSNYEYCSCSDYGGGHGIAIWQSCDGMPESQWIMTGTQDLEDMEITVTDSVICLGESVTLSLDIQPQVGATVYYEWSVGGDLISQDPSITVSPSVTTTYAVLFVHTNEGVECATETEITVTVNPVPTAGVSTPQTITCGESAEITATGGGTYSWNTTPEQTTATINVSPSVTTTYTVTVENAYGCTDEANTQVTVLPTEVSLSGPLTMCSGDTIFCIQGLESNSTLTWGFPEGVTYVSISDSCIAVTDWNDSESSYISVTMTDTIVGCVAADSIIVVSCCIPDTGNIVFTDTTITVTTTQTLSGAFAVNGILYLDGGGTMTFSNADVVMGAFAQIILLNGTDLTLTDATHIYPCDLWHYGIYGEDDSRFVMNGHSLIEGALNAVNLRYSAYFNIDSAHFLNNYRHLAIADYPTYPYGFPVVKNTTMYCTELLPSPAYNLITERAVEIVNNEVKWLFGPNVVIDSARVGIWLRNSSLEVYNDTIRNITPGGTDPWSGTGIFSNGLWGGIDLRVSGTKFHDNQLGIYAKQCEMMTVYSNKFSQQLGGEYYSDNGTVNTSANHYSDLLYGLATQQNDNLHIYNSRFDDNHYGILSNFDSKVKIHNDTINVHPASPDWAGYGINIENNVNGQWNTWNVDVYDNIVTNAKKGIRLKDTYWARVRDNNVSIVKHADEPSWNLESRAINADHTNVSWISSNIVGSDIAGSNYGWWDTGIRGDFNTLSWITCNETDSLHNAMVSGGTAPATFIFDNVMSGYHYRGIMQNWGSLPIQGSPTNPTDNEWHDTFLFNHTDEHQTSGGPTGFYVRDVTPGTTPFHPDPFVANSQQGFPISPIIANPATESQYDCDSIVYMRNVDHLQKIALDSISYTGAGEDSLAMERLSKLQLFQSIVSDSILQLDGILVAFADTFETTDLGKLQAVANQLDLNITESNRDKFVGDLNSVNPTDTIASLWKETLLMAFGSWADDDSTTVLSASDSTRLWAIGSLCPYNHGPSVYLARTMLFSLDSAYMSIGNTCEIPAYYEPSGKWDNEDPSEAETNVDENQLTVSVYPNPATEGFLTVQILGDMEGGVAFSIYSIEGRIMRSENLVENVTTVDVRHLSSGIYFVKISNAQGQNIWRNKVVFLNQ